ncbi:hypothetical protein SteCoe_13664 [Stentor coeruleus]|uniref:Uncharacterized protein n=1 Tax=Stentor coeruleus TaxID=5963 RepID=A0A1R2C7V5_9CILI|nr:hypothetical protein SteCoe_13664 [Stentor coeruleus]
MQSNIIKLKRVQYKVKFATKHTIIPINPKVLPDVKFDKSPKGLKSSMSPIKTSPKKFKSHERIRKLPPTPKANLNNIPSLMFKKVTEEINMITKEIDNFVRDKSSKTYIQDHKRRSKTPPISFKVTKQSFPDLSFKLPKVID